MIVLCIPPGLLRWISWINNPFHKEVLTNAYQAVYLGSVHGVYHFR